MSVSASVVWKVCSSLSFPWNLAQFMWQRRPFTEKKITKPYDDCLPVTTTPPGHQFSHGDSFLFSSSLIYFNFQYCSPGWPFLLHLSDHISCVFVHLKCLCFQVLKDSCWQPSHKSLCVSFHICSLCLSLLLRILPVTHMNISAPSFIEGKKIFL